MQEARDRWGEVEELSTEYVNKPTEDWEPLDYSEPKIRDTKKKLSRKKRKAKRKNQRRARKAA